MTSFSPDPWPLVRLIEGYWVSRAVHAAAELGVADGLRDGPRTVGELAHACGAHEESLYRLLRALASVGVFAEQEGRVFAQSPLSDMLRRDHPQSLWGHAMLHASAAHWQAWQHLADSVRAGAPAAEQALGEGWLARMTEDAELAPAFELAMDGLTSNLAPRLLEYDFSRARRIVDVGGGYGALLTAILERYPEARGVLFDQPAVIERARHRLAKTPCWSRLELAAGDFFDGVPSGGDLYILKLVVHDWDDERAAVILASCRRAMSQDSRLLILDALLPEQPQAAHPAKLTDLEMMAFTDHGRERTAPEMRTLLARAGFVLCRTIPTLTSVALIEAAPAPPGPERQEAEVV